MFTLSTYSFTSFYFIDECVLQEMKRLTTFANWELLVPRLTKYRLSHISP